MFSKFSKLLFLLVLINLNFIYSKDIKLHIPIIEDSPNQHLFFHELLEKALKENEQTPILISSVLPQLRTKMYLDNGNLTIYWMIETRERNEKYIPIKVGLTNGLIGKRVLFIKKDNQDAFDNVKNLDDFRKLNLVAGMGESWYDVKVWKENNLNYKTQSGNWKVIFKMISKGVRYDYFPRGINEILVEAKNYPYLGIEKNLVFIYDRDYIFYLSKEGKNAGIKYKDIIEKSLLKAKKSGLLEKLIQKYWKDDFEKLNYDERIKLHLKTPK